VRALSLVDDPLVIPLLVKYAREAPNTTKTAAVALRRFISTKEGLEAMESLGAEFAPDDVYPDEEWHLVKELDYGGFVSACVLQSFEMTERAPSEKFLKAQLSSKNEGRVSEALDFLVDSRQQANQAPLDEIEKLTKHEKEYISTKSTKVLEKISKVKVEADF